MANIVLFERMMRSQIDRRISGIPKPPNSDLHFYWDLLFYLIDVSKNTQVLIFTNGQSYLCRFLSPPPLSLSLPNPLSLSLSLFIPYLVYSPTCFTCHHFIKIAGWFYVWLSFEHNKLIEEATLFHLRLHTIALETHQLYLLNGWAETPF